MTVDKKEDTICFFTTEILNIAENCSNIKFDEKSARKSFDYLLNKIDEIYKLSELSLSAGQNMEDRLYEYRIAIEGLGFKRKEKGEE
jgi:hypothetical protein